MAAGVQMLMGVLLLLLLAGGGGGGGGGAEGHELLGYVENWVGVKWWDNVIPGNCLMGCFEAEPFLSGMGPYSAGNYGFVFLTETPTPSQVDCSGGGGCPVWDGKAVYAAAASKSGAGVAGEGVAQPSPGVVAIAEAVRMAHMHPLGAKRFKVTLGGWSDFARLGSEEKARGVAKLMAEVVQWTFADGVDLDFEHLTLYNASFAPDEFRAFATLVRSLRDELDALPKQWGAFAKQRAAALQAEFDALPAWQKQAAAPYYNTSIRHLGEVGRFGANHLEISWTTRFNAFVPASDPFNYLKPGSPRPNATFATDNEGAAIWPAVGDVVDTVNVMAYDAGGLSLDFETILRNFETLGKVPAEKLNIGFEPGEQAAGGIWEGLDEDKATASYVAQHGGGGAMIWAVNPSPSTNPQGAKDCPIVARAVSQILRPSWRWGSPPNYTRCDPTTGWWP